MSIQILYQITLYTLSCLKIIYLYLIIKKIRFPRFGPPNFVRHILYLFRPWLSLPTSYRNLLRVQGVYEHRSVSGPVSRPSGRTPPTGINRPNRSKESSLARLIYFCEALFGDDCQPRRNASTTREDCRVGGEVEDMLHSPWPPFPAFACVAGSQPMTTDPNRLAGTALSAPCGQPP
jgi:hypothetical protein